MAKYRKLPVVISAFVLGRQWPQDECNEWFHNSVTSGIITTYNMGSIPDSADAPYIEIKTLEGVMRGEAGDFIIRGVNGEIYPCKPDIFNKTYVEVHPDEKD